MRLDKFLANAGICSRRECGRLVKTGEVTVDGEAAKSADMHIDPEKQQISVRGEAVIYEEFVYIMLNKPEGVVSSTDDPKSETVIDLLDERLKKLGLFPCGRLDKNTLGLVILTNDGITAHKLLAPKNHVEKEYSFKCKFPLAEEDIMALESGVVIGDGYVTKPARVMLHTEKEGNIIITEGKYHEIKLMLQAVHNQITYLERIRFGPINLDADLERGDYRPLSETERELFLAAAK